MPREERELYWKRRWLNTKGHHSTAFVYAYISTWANDSKNFDGEITISDCSRQITLSLDTWGTTGRAKESAYKNSLNKLNTLIDTLTEARDAITEYWEES